MDVKILTRIKDEKINALNVLAEIKISDYLLVADEIVDKNEMQRKKVKSSKSVYSLLRRDLKQGCTIPPIFLAIKKDVLKGEDVKEDDVEAISDKDIIKYIEEKKLIILDGLQRTYQMLDLKKELESTKESDVLEKFLNRKIRLEIYIGINKVGILYRMLTLNTGQTPMSTRHQIEILYQDYLEKTNLENVELIKEIGGVKKIGVGVYKFSEVIDGFQSYLEKNELSIDRSALLDDIKSLEKLSDKSQDSELFGEFLLSIHLLLVKINELSDDWNLDDMDYNKEFDQPFGKDFVKFFVKTQVFTGFGAAIGMLEDAEMITSFEELNKSISKIEMGESIESTYYEFLICMEHIRTTSKKIGNGQRRFFYHFFKSLFFKESDSYLNMYKAIKKALQTYKVEFL